FFVLWPQVLLYFRSKYELGSEPGGVVPLDGAKLEVVDYLQDPTQKFCLAIDHPSRRTFVLAAGERRCCVSRAWRVTPSGRVQTTRRPCSSGSTGSASPRAPRCPPRHVCSLDPAGAGAASPLCSFPTPTSSRPAQRKRPRRKG